MLKKLFPAAVLLLVLLFSSCVNLPGKEQNKIQHQNDQQDRHITEADLLLQGNSTP